MNIFSVDEKYHEYLTDESQYHGSAESISFPENEQQVREVCIAMKEAGTPITIQGGRTGIVGAAVPSCGHIMNLSKMDTIRGFDRISGDSGLVMVDPGITLLDLQKNLRSITRDNQLFWPPDPTEPTATLGGIAAAGAKGCCSYLYGETSPYIDAIRYLDSQGNLNSLRRGQSFSMFHGRRIDDVDLFLGSEGIYGVMTELTLKVVKQPSTVWGICFFFSVAEDSGSFLDQAIHLEPVSSGAAIAALEYIDRTSINTVHRQKTYMAKIRDLPDVNDEFEALVYCEIHGSNEEAVEAIAHRLLALAEQHDSDTDAAWALAGEYEVEKLRSFRHAVPESVNTAIREVRQHCPGIMKLSTDMTARRKTPGTLIGQYQEALQQSGLYGCVFGHAGAGHLHMNIIPRNMEEYIRGLEVVGRLGGNYSRNGDVVFSEHGVGKLKKSLFIECYGGEFLDEIRRKKLELDPAFLWNPGTVLDME